MHLEFPTSSIKNRAVHIFRIALFSLLLCAAICSSQIRVACIGNSITERSGYPRMLQKLLGPEYIVENDGVGGTTLLRSGTKPYWTEGKLGRVGAFGPQRITIMLGTNDTKRENWERYGDDFTRDYLALIDTLHTLPTTPEIWIVIPAPIWPNRYGIRDSVMQRIIPLLHAIAAKQGLPVIDAYSPLVKFKRYFSDGVHPNAAGADTIAHAIYRALVARQ
jgi:acyl-CoA thioesterase I